MVRLSALYPGIHSQVPLHDGLHTTVMFRVSQGGTLHIAVEYAAVQMGSNRLS
jgi:hypothetical protein